MQPIRSELLWHKPRRVLCMPGMWLRVCVGFFTKQGLVQERAKCGVNPAALTTDSTAEGRAGIKN